MPDHPTIHPSSRRRDWAGVASIVWVVIVIAIALIAATAPILLPAAPKIDADLRKIAAAVIFATSYLALAAGKVPGYKFSLAMKTSHVVWTNDTLESFLRNPNVLITGTNMPQGGGEMHIGVPNAEDRGDIIAYLRSLRG